LGIKSSGRWWYEVSKDSLKGSNGSKEEEEMQEETKDNQEIARDVSKERKGVYL